MTSTPLPRADQPAFPQLAGMSASGAACGMTIREVVALTLYSRCAPLGHVNDDWRKKAWQEAEAFLAADPRNQDAPRPKAGEVSGGVSHGEDVRQDRLSDGGQQLSLGDGSDVPEAPHGGVLESRNAASSASAEAVADSLRADPGPTERGEGAVAGPSPLNQDDGAFASDEEDAALVAMGRELWSAFLQPGESLCSVGAITLDGDILEENYWTRAFPTNSTVLRNEARAILRRVRRERDAQGGSVAR